MKTLLELMGDSWKLPSPLSITVCTVLCIVSAYLLGSINFGVVWSRLLYKDDVRHHGSGNAGSTNMLRNYGKTAGVITFLGDAVKTIVAVLLGWAIFGSYGAYICGLFCIMGHMFPIFFKFKGGKGVVCLAMMVLFTDWRVFLFLVCVFLIIVIGTKYVSLGSVICAMIYPVVLNRMNKNVPFGWLIATIVAALIVFMHRENIKRLLAGNENKLGSKKKKKAEEKEETEENEENVKAAADSENDD